MRQAALRAPWLALALLLPGCGPSQSERSHNVVLITLDTTRADYLSCYGHPVPTTPALDELAAEGCRFELCVSTAALTPVSHASIFTGLNPYQHGLRVMDAGEGYRLDEKVPTLASTLRARGWRCGAFVSAFPVTGRFGLDQGFEVFDDGGSGKVTLKPLDGGDTRWDGTVQRRSDKTTDAALEWLSGIDEPFLLWIHYWDPHDQNEVPPQETLERFGPGYDDSSLSGEERYKEVYRAEIAYVDLQFRRVVDALKARGIYGNTVFAVTSDHGEGLWEHGWRDHKILYQEQLHVPLILRLPERPARAVVEEMVRTIDIFPTLLDVLGISAPGPLEGSSLTPLMRGETGAPRVAYADALNKFDTNARLHESRPQDLLLYMAMDRRWKLIFRPDDPDASELYDLERDPQEAENRYDGEEAERSRLLGELRARAPWSRDLGPSETDEGILEALKELGYY